MIGPPAQSTCRRQRPCGGQQASDLQIGVKIWLCALESWENPGRRHFSPRFNARQMAGETPDVCQAQSPGTMAIGRQGRPLERETVGDDRCATLVHERHEICQASLLMLELVSQATAHGDVLPK